MCARTERNQFFVSGIFAPIRRHPRARRKSFLKVFAAKTDFPAVFADDSKCSSFVRKICYTAPYR
jgi:hypothetical protein